MSRPFIRGQVAIDSMRDNGFLSAAHALAELIDNSIQAGADRVELITFESRKDAGNGERSTKRIEKIGVLDNGCGMSSETLHLALEFGASENRKDSHGIGKFGMGLPNSSISQCKHVDVWSWTAPDEIYYTYLDIEEIKDGILEDIPVPVRADIPDDIKSACGESLPKSGTFVLWSKIDRCQWKTGKSIYKHTQDIVGRMYRNFLNDEKVSIRFKSTELSDSLFLVTENEEHKFLANDPLYLMKNTSLPDLPGEFKGEAMFEYYHDCCYSIQIADEHGQKQEVQIKGTILKKSVLDAMKSTTAGFIGSTAWGKHAAKNFGVSIVRSGRELSLAPEFIEPRMKEKGRWYGIEVSFDPALDNIFGVTNNKQHVVNLKMMRESDDYEREGFESEQDYRSDLRANNDPKLRIYEIVKHIKEVEEKLIQKVDTFDLKGTANGLGTNTNTEIPVGTVTTTVNIKEKEREEVHPTEPPSITIDEIKGELEGIGADNPEEKAETILENQLQVWVEEIPMATNAFFDVTTKKGFTLLQINSNHVFSKEILNKVPDSQREALEICLAGWARLERECNSEKRLAQLQKTREDWGQLLDDYLDSDDEV